MALPIGADDSSLKRGRRRSAEATATNGPSPLGMRASSSAPTLPAIKGASSAGTATNSSIYSRMWAPEHKRFLHERRERRWLRSKAKHKYIDFSDSERAELKRYFDALAERAPKMRLNKLEDMLISLGLAEDREDVAKIVEALDGDCSVTGELDFEEYLDIIRSRTDSDIFPIFKAMMEGTLGDRSLNFQTVISSYRRQLVLDHMTTKVKKDPSDGHVLTLQEFQAKYKGKYSPDVIQQRWNLCPQDDPQKKGGEILENFATLMKSRYDEKVEAGVRMDSKTLPFEVEGSVAPMGGLAMFWRGVATEKELVSSRPTSADGRSQRTVEPPLSPRSVVNKIVKVKINKNRTAGRTIIVREAPYDVSKNPAAL